ncbi:LOW QUALITY PROTEIN: TRAF3-interacting protein 1, partial [Galemys pyrenaicus]
RAGPGAGPASPSGERLAPGRAGAGGPGCGAAGWRRCRALTVAWLVSKVIRMTGFMKGLYSDAEMKSDNVKEKDAKISFLQKAIDVVVLVSGEPLAAKPARIVAGHEPERTNELLQLIGKCCLGKLSSDDAVKRVLAGEKGDPRGRSSLASKPKEPDRKSARKSEVQERSASRDREQQGELRDDGPAREEEKARESGRDRHRGPEREKHREGDREKSKPRARAAGDRDRGARDRDRDTDRERERRGEGGKEKDRWRDRDRDQRRARNGEHPRDPDREKSREHEKLEKKCSRWGLCCVVSPARSFLQDGDRQDVAAGGPQAVQAAVQALRGRRLAQRCRCVAGARFGRRLDTGSRACPSFPTLGPRRLPRPGSARPAPPRVKRQESSEALAVDRAGSGKVANVIVDSQRSDEEDDSQFVVAAAPPLAEAAELEVPAVELEEDEKHGGLVKKILETKKDYEKSQPPTPGSKEKLPVLESAWRKEKDIVSKEIEKLRASIQTLCRSALPLGKIMDYIQEDVDAMQHELQLWRCENRQHAEALRREQSITDGAVEPLRAELAELEQLIREQQDRICAVKANVLRNEEKIQKMVCSLSLGSGRPRASRPQRRPRDNRCFQTPGGARFLPRRRGQAWPRSPRWVWPPGAAALPWRASGRREAQAWGPYSGWRRVRRRGRCSGPRDFSASANAGAPDRPLAPLGLLLPCLLGPVPPGAPAPPPALAAGLPRRRPHRGRRRGLGLAGAPAGLCPLLPGPAPLGGRDPVLRSGPGKQHGRCLGGLSKPLWVLRTAQPGRFERRLFRAAAPPALGPGPAPVRQRVPGTHRQHPEPPAAVRLQAPAFGLKSRSLRHPPQQLQLVAGRRLPSQHGGQPPAALPPGLVGLWGFWGLLSHAPRQLCPGRGPHPTRLRAPADVGRVSPLGKVPVGPCGPRWAGAIPGHASGGLRRAWGREDTGGGRGIRAHTPLAPSGDCPGSRRPCSRVLAPWRWGSACGPERARPCGLSRAESPAALAVSRGAQVFATRMSGALGRRSRDLPTLLRPPRGPGLWSAVARGRRGPPGGQPRPEGSSPGAPPASGDLALRREQRQRSPGRLGRLSPGAAPRPRRSCPGARAAESLPGGPGGGLGGRWGHVARRARAGARTPRLLCRQAAAWRGLRPECVAVSSRAFASMLGSRWPVRAAVLGALGTPAGGLPAGGQVLWADRAGHRSETAALAHRGEAPRPELEGLDRAWIGRWGPGSPCWADEEGHEVGTQLPSGLRGRSPGVGREEPQEGATTQRGRPQLPTGLAAARVWLGLPGARRRLQLQLRLEVSAPPVTREPGTLGPRHGASFGERDDAGGRHGVAGGGGDAPTLSEGVRSPSSSRMALPLLQVWWGGAGPRGRWSVHPGGCSRAACPMGGGEQSALASPGGAREPLPPPQVLRVPTAARGLPAAHLLHGAHPPTGCRGCPGPGLRPARCQRRGTGLWGRGCPGFPALGASVRWGCRELAGRRLHSPLGRGPGSPAARGPRPQEPSLARSWGSEEGPLSHGGVPGWLSRWLGRRPGSVTPAPGHPSEGPQPEGQAGSWGAAASLPCPDAPEHAGLTPGCPVGRQPPTAREGCTPACVARPTLELTARCPSGHARELSRAVSPGLSIPAAHVQKASLGRCPDKHLSAAPWLRLLPPTLAAAHRAAELHTVGEAALRRLPEQPLRIALVPRAPQRGGGSQGRAALGQPVCQGSPAHPGTPPRHEAHSCCPADVRGPLG